MTRPEPHTSSTRSRPWLIGALAVAVSIGASVVVASVVETAESRFAGSTSNRGSLLSAGEVELTLVGDSADGDAGPDLAAFSIDASNVVPGQQIQRCILIAYRGSVDSVDLHVYGRLDAPDAAADAADSGLEQFIDATFEVGSGADPACDDFEVPALDPVSWTGRLSTFAASRNSYASGIPILEDAPSEATTTLRVDLELIGDNAAQGRSTAFWLIVEVRP